MITIYHNPRCSKSRAACTLVDRLHHSDGEPVELIEYLKQPPSVDQLAALHRMLGCSVQDMVRVDEAEYRELSLDRTDVTDGEKWNSLVRVRRFDPVPWRVDLPSEQSSA